MKRQIKQTLAKVLVVCMILSMLPVSAFATETEVPEQVSENINWQFKDGAYCFDGDVKLQGDYYIVGDAESVDYYKINTKINTDTATKTYTLSMDTIYVQDVDTLTVGGYIYATTSDTATFKLTGSGLVLKPTAAEAHVTIAPYETKARTAGIALFSANAGGPTITVSGNYDKDITLTDVDATVDGADVKGTLAVDEKANVTVTGTKAENLTVTNATAELTGKTEVTGTLKVETGATVTATGTKAGNLTVTGDKSTAKLTDVTVGTKLEVGTGAVVTVASGTLAAVDVTGGTLTIGDPTIGMTAKEIKITGGITVAGESAKLVLGENVTLDKDTKIKVEEGASLEIPQKLAERVNGDYHVYDANYTVTVAAEVDGKPFEDATFTYTVTKDAKTVEGTVKDGKLNVLTDSNVELTVKADGYRVTGWQVGKDDVYTTTSDTYTVKVDVDVKVTAILEPIPMHEVTFVVKGEGTIKATYKVGTDTKAVDVKATATIADGTELALKATPADGYKFVGWTITGVKENATTTTTTYVVEDDATITAVFEKTPVSHEVTFNPAKNGTYTATYALDKYSDVTVNVEGDVVTKTFDKDTELTLAATPAKGYEFDHWVINEEVVTKDTYMITGDTTITAVFKKLPVEYTVTVAVEPVEGGTVTYTIGKDTNPVNGKITFKEGETVTLTAKANDDYKFVGWQVDGKTVETKDTYTVTADAEITAVFEQLPVTQYNLKITVDPANSGTVTGAGKYIAGATVNVTAKASNGYKFDGWYVGKELKSTDAMYSFVITADTELTAKFSKEEEPPEPKTVTVEVKATTGGTATVNGETKVEVEAGTTVTLVATAASGYEFVNWTDASGEEVTVGADGKYKADESVVLTANFKAKTPSGPVGPFIPSGPTGPSTPSHVCPSAAYTDVNQNMWYHEAVDYVVEHGYMQGTTATEFAPNANIKRADVALVLYRMQNSPAVEVGATYSDVDAGAYYAAAVAWADANGIVNGYGDGTFKPNKEITREELVAVMSRYAAFLNANVTGSASLARFVDAADVSAYAVAPMQWAVQTAIIQGTSISTLVPKHTATRAQFAAMIMRLCENVLAK